MDPPLSQRLADQVRQWLAKSPGVPVPSLSALARQLHASQFTMRKAVRLLVKEGLLVCSQGRNVRRTDVEEDGGVPTSSGTLFRKIKEAIEDGTYRIGEEFPKSEHFVLTEHVSSATVVEAFTRLRDAGLAHRRGKKWIVGAGAVRTLASMKGVQTFDGSPVLVVLFNYGNDWSTFVTWPHTAGFSQPFIDEIDKYGMHLSIAAVSQTSNVASSVPTGITGITALIRSLGNRYCGTLVVPTGPYADELPRIMKAIATFGKPVVCFDGANICGSLTREAVASRKLYRLYFDERSALTSALDRLRDLGHAVVGVPIYTGKNYDWTTRRFELLNELAGKDDTMRLVGVNHNEPFWNFEDPGDLHHFVTRIAEERIPGAGTDGSRPDLRQLLIRETPSLVSLLRDHQVTALIALSDRMAREYYYWLQSVGIAIPRDLSIVSFDNHRESIAFPVSTVDFGFSRLGYLAAHIFIDDITVRTGGTGSLAGVCRLRERGSLGVPRRKRVAM